MSTDFRLAPGLHAVQDSPEGMLRLCLQSTTSRPPVVVDDPRLPWALDNLPAGRFTYEDVRDGWAREQELSGLAQELWDFCVDRGLIVPGDVAVRGPSYHVATRDHPFLDMGRAADSLVEDNELMQDYLEEGEFPSVYLDLGQTDVAFEDATHLETAQFWADPLQQYSLLLSGTFGQRRHLAPYADDIYGYTQVEMVQKSIPSGGSKHPTEAFVVVVRSGVLAAGTYHYSVRLNGLVRLSEAPIDQPTGVTVGDEVVLVLLTSAVERAMWRYRDSRSFRALLVDVGHAEAHLSALAAYVGWRCEGLPLNDSIRALAATLPVDPSLHPLLGAVRLERK